MRRRQLCPREYSTFHISCKAKARFFLLSKYFRPVRCLNKFSLVSVSTVESFYANFNVPNSRHIRAIKFGTTLLGYHDLLSIKQVCNVHDIIIGLCRAGEKGGCLPRSLYGVERLRLVDSTINPKDVGSNTIRARDFEGKYHEETSQYSCGDGQTCRHMPNVIFGIPSDILFALLAW